MKHRIAALFCMLFSAGLLAQTIKAEDLEKICTGSADSDRMSCALIVKVYMDGFIEGVGKGVIDTYKYDPQVLALVQDVKMKEMAPRLAKVVELSTCIQRLSVSDMTNAYVDYMRKTPAMKQENYRKAMTRAIVATYCQK
ncbi:MAG: hypothetical protein Q7U63_05555 [Polaromonas sp.]|uniref:hypothetical protein n=1 Tax=Polaromonas sp. TaxID=1869339 RepID=UPI00271A6963|nr:hypothetical protein [Polaromonas sp.]MDO9113246.1 hypothetical protein [Polaromonas sp.]MDP1886935.1 hypothetical protein [Polaromonas sp.]